MSASSSERFRILVTGGAGFIGSHLVEALVAEGHDVRVVDDLSSGKRSNLDHIRGPVEFIEADLTDFDACRRAAEGVDYVFHQAAMASVPRSVAEPLKSHNVGPSLTLNVLEASRQAGVRRVMFAASSSAYGDTETLPKVETMYPQPLSPYAAGKLAGEHYIKAYAESMGLDGVSLRYFNIFGPRQDPSSPYSGVISLFTTFMASGRAPSIYGDGSQTRDFTYVTNAVKANLLAMKHPKPLRGEVFNVGVGEQISLLDLIRTINEIQGTDLQPSFLSPRAGDVKHSLADLTRIREVLGYEPEIGFKEGLGRTMAWASGSA